MSSRNIVRVEDVMTTPPITVDGLANIRTAIELMQKEGINSLVIEKRNEDDEYGIISVHDISEKVLSVDHSIDRKSVYEVMTKPVLGVHRRMNVKYALRLLTRFNLSRALVMEHGNMVGIVTIRDMAVRYDAG